MLHKHRMILPLIVIALAALVGCATVQPRPDFTPQDLTGALQAGQYVQKTETFLVVLDGSHSMEGRYADTKLIDLAKTTLHNFNATVPNLKLTGGLHVFGSHSSCVKAADPALPYPLGPYTRAGFAAAIDTVKCGYGLSPLAEAVHTSQKLLSGTSGHLALMIISDGIKIPGEPVLNAVGALKGEFGNLLCVYAVQVGDDPDGAVLMSQIAGVGNCGRALNADDLLSPAAMADLVREMFLAQAPPPPPVAPAPPPPPKPIIVFDDNIMFEFDKAVIRPSYYPVLNEAVQLLQKDPGLRVEVAGHTCNLGPAAYNLKLSERRAQAVKDYLVSQGIAADRLVVKGYGLTQPAYPNDTRENRAKNRRTELLPIR